MIESRPHQELELKAVIPDLVAVRRRLVEAGAVLIFRGRMQDRRYDRHHELDRADQVLRTRRMVPENGAAGMILGWKGPARVSEDGYKLREELEYQISGGTDPEPLLRALGFVEVFAIDRWIETWAVGGATLRLEQYPLMDPLIEVEGEPAGIETAIQISGIDRDEFRTDSLAEFVARYQKRTGRTARVSGDVARL
ncbi:MAG: hypothetical protein ABI679_01540 [Gemmatimonadota bacterium]